MPSSGSALPFRASGTVRRRPTHLAWIVRLRSGGVTGHTPCSPWSRTVMTDVWSRRFPERGTGTEGGEALSTAVVNSSQGSIEPGASRAAQPAAPRHVLWTNSHCEEIVSSQLAARGFHPFVPRIETWTRRGGARRLGTVPLFPGYLFLNDALDKARHVEVRKARGVVAILGEGWDRPAVIPDA